MFQAVSLQRSAVRQTVSRMGLKALLRFEVMVAAES
jgi:hypothetical protein